MKTVSLRRIAVAAAIIAPLGFAVHAATVSRVDSRFVGKVSQGGSFEVQASQLAATRAASLAVKAFAEQDVADHEKVNDELKSIAAAQDLPLAPSLKPSLQKKLDALGKLSGPGFDQAYIAQMAKIHHKDEGIFAREAQRGTSADWKAFAGKTDQIVKGHIAALDQIQTVIR
jgi:putative membrane protein